MTPIRIFLQQAGVRPIGMIGKIKLITEIDQQRQPANAGHVHGKLPRAIPAGDRTAIEQHAIVAAYAEHDVTPGTNGVIYSHGGRKTGILPRKVKCQLGSSADTEAPREDPSVQRQRATTDAEIASPRPGL